MVSVDIGVVPMGLAGLADDEVKALEERYQKMLLVTKHEELRLLFFIRDTMQVP